MNEEVKQRLIDKCQLTYDEDDGQYLTNHIMTPVSPALDVVILHNIESNNVICFTACEMANTLVGKMTAVYYIQLWENGCYTDVLDRIPNTGQLYNAEILYDLITEQKFDTIGYIKYKKILTKAIVPDIQPEYHDLHYVFPIPRSAIFDESRPLSKGDNPKFYLNGEELGEFKSNETKMWKSCYGRYKVTDTLIQIHEDVYVQKDALDALLNKRYNQFNLILWKQVSISNSSTSLRKANLYLVCPTNGDVVLARIPDEEFADCRRLSRAEIRELRNNSNRDANVEFVRDELGGEVEDEEEEGEDDGREDDGREEEDWEDGRLEEDENREEEELSDWENISEEDDEEVEVEDQDDEDEDDEEVEVEDQDDEDEDDEEVEDQEVKQDEEDEEEYDEQEEKRYDLQNAVAKGRREIRRLRRIFEIFNETEVDDVPLPLIQDMHPNNQEIVWEVLQNHRQQINYFEPSIHIPYKISDLLYLYMRGFTKDSERVRIKYTFIVNILTMELENPALIEHEVVERLNNIDLVIQTLLNSPLPNFVKVIAKKKEHNEAKITGIDDDILTHIRDIEDNIVAFPMNDEASLEALNTLTELYKYTIKLSRLQDYLTHQDDFDEFVSGLVQERLVELYKFEQERILSENIRKLGIHLRALIRQGQTDTEEYINGRTRFLEMVTQICQGDDPVIVERDINSYMEGIV